MVVGLGDHVPNIVVIGYNVNIFRRQIYAVLAPVLPPRASRGIQDPRRVQDSGHAANRHGDNSPGRPSSRSVDVNTRFRIRNYRLETICRRCFRFRSTESQQKKPGAQLVLDSLCRFLN